MDLILAPLDKRSLTWLAIEMGTTTDNVRRFVTKHINNMASDPILRAKLHCVINDLIAANNLMDIHTSRAAARFVAQEFPLLSSPATSLLVAHLTTFIKRISASKIAGLNIGNNYVNHS